MLYGLDVACYLSSPPKFEGTQQQAFFPPRKRETLPRSFLSHSPGSTLPPRSSHHPPSRPGVLHPDLPFNLTWPARPCALVVSYGCAYLEAPREKRSDRLESTDVILWPQHEEESAATPVLEVLRGRVEVALARLIQADSGGTRLRSEHTSLWVRGGPAYGPGASFYPP
ncbi:hypothetical protein EDB85DRAFT_2143648 [Lactarius pseudohatsudake]|nr:hypothetical protein EDB85DRAFT_2143648 [Lactarius pseudohatsudake]